MKKDGEPSDLTAAQDGLLSGEHSNVYQVPGAFPISEDLKFGPRELGDAESAPLCYDSGSNAQRMPYRGADV